MKNKVISIIISFLFLMISLVIILSIYFIPDFCVKSLILNIAYSLFGGSVLAFLIYIADYSTIKKKTINDFYDEGNEFLKALNAIEYFDVSEKELIIAEYIFLKPMFEFDKKGKEEFVAKATNVFTRNGYSISGKDILAIINFEIEHFEKSITKAMMSYVELSKYVLNRLYRTSNDIFFFSVFARKFHKENIELCDMTKQMLEKVARPSLHFDLLLKKESSNIIVITNLIKNLNEYFFRIDRNKNITLAWKEKTNEFNELLNRFISVVEKREYKKRDYQPFISLILCK